LPGEIIPEDGFYSYNDKYVKANGAQLIAPAKLSKSQIKKLQASALEAYKSLECRGFARVDMFMMWYI
jgi:D-alanine-D-alanine ligase